MRPICIVFRGQPYPLPARTGKAMVPVAVPVDGDNLSGKHAARIREIAGHLGSPTVLRIAALTDRHQAPHPDIEAQLQGIVRSTSTVARSRASEGPSEPPRSRPSEFCAGPGRGASRIGRPGAALWRPAGIAPKEQAVARGVMVPMIAWQSARALGRPRRSDLRFCTLAQPKNPWWGTTNRVQAMFQSRARTDAA
jgi:hypothetical protein